ncbi:hypothetical protein KO561_12830 [Radiobacillus kanasensis]|uniref:DUF6527 family protein n=1 Tax=Radiobacillus kanasensis TaxID=2844358 RepID=UPI001E45AD06|nr:DUF6527 family protein [Radiobacillus kanasensis]UFT98087.1 hypothetical protein KO561_12830 [Radiobacillus kanasensis]
MKVVKTSDKRLIFYCEGCENTHGVNNAWNFNGNFENPTFSPSILVKGTRPITDDEHEGIMSGEKIEPEKFVCHSFVRDGNVQYLNDCTHELAGQTVELRDEAEWSKE